MASNGEVKEGSQISGKAFDQLRKHVAVNAIPVGVNSPSSKEPLCHPGTREGILGHLLAWSEALTYTYPIKWLYGSSGIGKSTILRTVAFRLLKKRCLLAQFFFSRTSAGRNTAKHLITTIAYQVAFSIPDVRPHIEQAIERNQMVFSLPMWEQARVLIISPILAAHSIRPLESYQTPRIIIVDGLNECHEDDQQWQILHVLCRLIGNLPIPFAVLVASRPEHCISSAFEVGDLVKISSPVSLDDSYELHTDNRKFLKHKFRKIRKKHPLRSMLPEDWPSEEVVETVISKASGKFIYVATLEKFISSAEHNPAELLDDIINPIFDSESSEPFRHLDILYSLILQTIDPFDLKDTLRVLGALLVPFSTGPKIISKAFLERLLGLPPGGIRLLLFDLQCLLTFREDDDQVQFHNCSFPEFLFDKSRAGRFWIDAGVVYADLTQQCILQLSKSTDWRGSDYSIFFLDQHKLLFSKSKPTTSLHAAIKCFNLQKVDRSTTSKALYYFDLRIVFLQAVRMSRFPDSEALYRTMLSAYARIIRPQMRMYSRHTNIHYLLIAAITSESLHSATLSCLFPIPCRLRCYDRKQGFRIVDSEIRPDFKQIMKDLLNDQEGEYFVNGDKYADISMHLLESMTAGSESYINPGHRPNYFFHSVEKCIGNILPIFLSKSAIREDLIHHLKSKSLSAPYIKYTPIADAITTYLLKVTGRRYPDKLDLNKRFPILAKFP